MRISLALALALTLPLTACSSGSDPKALTDEGQRALGQSDHAAALASFEGALASMGTDSHPQYMRAKLGAVEALAVIDPARAQTEFLALATAAGLGANDYNSAAGWLASSHNFEQSLEVVHAGLEAFPEHAALEAVLARVVEASQDDPALQSKLQGLGYL